MIEGQGWAARGLHVLAANCPRRGRAAATIEILKGRNTDLRSSSGLFDHVMTFGKYRTVESLDALQAIRIYVHVYHVVLRVSLCMFACMCVCMSVCMYVSKYVCMYVTVVCCIVL